MPSLVFQQSPLVQFLLFSVHGTVVFLLGLAFQRWMRTRFANVASLVPVAPSFVAVSSVYALFLAFHAGSVWSHRHDAAGSLVEAHSIIRRFDGLLGPTQLDAPEARTALRRYVSALVNDEWKYAGNDRRSETAETALHDLQTILVQLERSAPAAIAAQLDRMLTDLARARNQWLWLGRHHTDAYAWMAVLLLGLMCHLSLASVHIDRPRAGALTMALFAGSTTIAYWTLGIADDPFRDQTLLDPTMLLQFTSGAGR
jgi:hypothetical protein